MRFTAKSQFLELFRADLDPLLVDFMALRIFPSFDPGPQFIDAMAEPLELLIALDVVLSLNF